MSGAVSLNTQAILLLTAPLDAGLKGPRDPILTPAEYIRLAQHLHSSRRQPADLLSPDAREVLEECAKIFAAERLKLLLDRGFRLSQALERWSTRAIWVVSRADETYPKAIRRRMKGKAPAIIYGAGDKDILDRGGVAVVGSRKAEPSVLNFAEEVGRAAARHGRVVISGAAKGVDQAAMRGAANAGGTVVGVLAEELERVALERNKRDALLANRLTLISEYDPSSAFSVHHAMARNKLIYALADAALVADAELDKGGTWAGAIEQLERLHFCRVYVRARGDLSEGLQALERRGALPWPSPASEADWVALAAAPAGGAQLQLTATEDGPEARADGDGAGSTAAALFSSVRGLILPLVAQSRTDADVAAALGVRLEQARDWLTRLVAEGKLVKSVDGSYSAAETDASRR